MAGINVFEGSYIKHFVRATSKDVGLGIAAYEEYFSFANSILKSNGYPTTVKILKEINTRARHYCAGYPKGDMDFGIWLKIEKTSFLPKKLSKLKRFLDLEPNIALSIPNYVYILRTKPDYSLKTVTDPSTVIKDKEAYLDFERWLSTRNLKLELSEVDINLSTKAGPIGPAFISQGHDMAAIALTINFKDLCERIYGLDNWIMESYNGLLDYYVRGQSKLDFKGKVPKVAKLAFVSGPAGKTRIVYILNWWLQMLLLPFHDSMMNYFRVIGNDATWDQDSAVEAIRKWSEDKSKLYSFDLSAATDRWPAEHQLLVIKKAFSETLGNDWSFMMTKFHPYVEEIDSFVPYAVGQPMGAYSSWAALNLTHHMVIRYLRDKLNLKSKDLYYVLGDDVVIRDEALAESYKDYMTNILGVKINMKKTIANEDGKPSSAEFARHIVRDGKVVGTVSPSLLKEIFMDHQWWKQLELLRELKNKLSLEILVDQTKILIPSPIDRLLRNKDDLFLVLAAPSTRLKLPVRLLDAPIDEDGYVSYPNPYRDVSPDKFDAYIASQVILRRVRRLKDLNFLHENLNFTRNFKFLENCLLESEYHPIRMMLFGLEEDLEIALYRVAGMSEFDQEFTLGTQATDLLIDVLIKGKSFRDWKDSKGKKQKAICTFFRNTYKMMLKYHQI
jgi:hypothetical protein